MSQCRSQMVNTNGQSQRFPEAGICCDWSNQGLSWPKETRLIFRTSGSSPANRSWSINRLAWMVFCHISSSAVWSRPQPQAPFWASWPELQLRFCKPVHSSASSHQFLMSPRSPFLGSSMRTAHQQLTDGIPPSRFRPRNLMGNPSRPGSSPTARPSTAVVSSVKDSLCLSLSTSHMENLGRPLCKCWMAPGLAGSAANSYMKKPMACSRILAEITSIQFSGISRWLMIFCSAWFFSRLKENWVGQQLNFLHPSPHLLFSQALFFWSLELSHKLWSLPASLRSASSSTMSLSSSCMQRA